MATEVERVYLTGFMTSGKSTIGPILANVLGWEFKDLDRVIEEIEGLLLGLTKKINDLESLEVGRNFNEGDAAYDLVLITTHQSTESLNRYQDHPEHIKVATRIKSLVGSRVVVDFII